MTDEEDKLMKQFGITFQTHTTFHFADYRYTRLEDAVSYAKTHPHLLPAAEHHTEKR